MNFKEIFRENASHDGIKVTKKYSFTLSSDSIFFEIYS